MDVKGSGSITDQVDNVVVVWRNKTKEQAMQVVVWRNKTKEQAMQAGGSYQPTDPDALLIIDKQRNGEFEGKVGLWFDRDSMQYLETSHQQPVDMLRAEFWK